VKAQRFHSSSGFYSAANPIQGDQWLLLFDSFPSHIPGQTTTLVDAFTRYDQQFMERWYDAALSPYNPTWKALPPPNQFVQNPALAVKVKQELRVTGSGKREPNVSGPAKSHQISQTQARHTFSLDS
jgi:hypothetical protein